MYIYILLEWIDFLCLYGTKRYNQFGTSVSVDRLWDTVKYRSNIQWLNWMQYHPWVYKIQFVYLGRLLCRILVFDFNKSRIFWKQCYLWCFLIEIPSALWIVCIAVHIRESIFGKKQVSKKPGKEELKLKTARQYLNS